MDGVPPVWPAVHRSLNLATNTYGRLLAEDNWHVSSKQKKNAYNTTPGGGPRTQSRNDNNHNRNSGHRGRKRYHNGNVKCWNCNKPGHTVPTCPEPRNEAAIEENRSKYTPRRGRCQPRDDKGRPVKFNKNQVYVVDVVQQRKETDKPNQNQNNSGSATRSTVSQQDKEEVKTMLGDIKQALTAAPAAARDGLQDQMNAITEKVKNW